MVIVVSGEYGNCGEWDVYLISAVCVVQKSMTCMREDLQSEVDHLAHSNICTWSSSKLKTACMKLCMFHCVDYSYS